MLLPSTCGSSGIVHSTSVKSGSLVATGSLAKSPNEDPFFALVEPILDSFYRKRASGGPFG